MEDILEKIFGDGKGQLNEDVQNQLTELIKEKAIELSNDSSLIEEKVNLALESQSQEHFELLSQINEKFEEEKNNIIEEYDSTAADKVKKTFDAVEAEREKSLTQVVEHYETKLQSDVNQQRDLVIEGVDKYFDKWLDEKVPHDLIKESARKDYSEELLGKISNLVGYHNTVDEDIRAGVEDAANQIKQLREENNKLKTEKFITESVKGLPNGQAKFITESLSGKDYDYVKRNLSYTKTLFEKKEEEQVITEQRKSIPVVKKQNNNPQLISENTQKVGGEEVSNPAMAGWINALKQNTTSF